MITSPHTFFRPRLLMFAGVVGATVLGGVLFVRPESSQVVRDGTYRVRVGDVEFLVEYASDEASRGRGLSGREPLGPREGLLFLFSSAASYGFWMKDMRFDIDIVWIRNSRVIGVVERVPAPRMPGDFLPTYYPPSAVDMVLEISAGVARESEIDVGDAVSLLE